jgi:hypothetical protein
MSTAPGVEATEPIGCPSRISVQVAPAGLVLIAISCEVPSMIEEHAVQGSTASKSKVLCIIFSPLRY